MIASCRSSMFTIQLPDTGVLNFWEIDKCDQELSKVNFRQVLRLMSMIYMLILNRLFNPFERSAVWFDPPPPITISPLSRDPMELLAPDTISVTLPDILRARPKPFKPQEAKQWTKKQREIAMKAPVLETVQDLVSNE